MRKKALHSIFLLVVFCRGFSQGEASVRSIRFDLGNNIFVNPITRTDPFSPSVQLNMVSGRRREYEFTMNSVVGLGYNYSVQTFNVTWPGAQVGQDKFFTHEFLFNLGGIAKYTLSKLSVGLLAVLQGGPNYTFTDDPRARVVVGGKKKAYKWEYLQFYFAPGLQLQYDLDEEISFQCGIIPRILVYREFLKEDFVDPIRFNHAPLKINLSVGFQANLFR